MYHSRRVGWGISRNQRLCARAIVRSRTLELRLVGFRLGGIQIIEYVTEFFTEFVTEFIPIMAHRTKGPIRVG